MNRNAGAARPAKPMHRRTGRSQEVVAMSINYKGVVRELPLEVAMRIRRAAKESGKSVEDTVTGLLREAQNVVEAIFLPCRC